MTMDLDKEISLSPFSISTNSLNFSSAFVTNSNHLDHVSSLPTQGFGYDFPSNLSRLGNHHLQNPSHSSLYQPQKGFEFGSSSTFPQLENHQILGNRPGQHPLLFKSATSLIEELENSFLYETIGHYDFSYIDSSSPSPPSMPLGSDKGFTNMQKGKRKIRENGSDGIRIQDDDNHYENGESNVEEAVGRRKRASNKKPKTTFGERSSMFRGVSRYTGRFEAFLWDNTDPSVKGKTVYVGGFDREEEAARAYDLAALKYWGVSAPLNFPVSDYGKELEKMQEMSRREYLLSIRRRSKGFAKGVSNYRGVSRNYDCKKWQARMGKGHDTRCLYLGTFNTEEEAATAYDMAVIKVKGLNAITNFDIHNYDIKSIMQSEMIPVGEGASKSLQRIAAKEILKIKTKDVKKSRALKVQEQLLAVPTNQNTQNIVSPPPPNPSSPQVILDLQGADHEKIDAQNVLQFQEDQSLISNRNPSSPSLFLYTNEVQEYLDSLPSHETTVGFEDLGFLANGVTDDRKLPFEMLENPEGDFLSANPSSPTLYPHQNPDAQLEGNPREGSKSNLVDLDDIIDPTAAKATNGSINALLESDFEQTITPSTNPDYQSLLSQSPNSQNFPTFLDGLADGASSRTGSISEAILGSNNVIDFASIQFLAELWNVK